MAFAANTRDAGTSLAARIAGLSAAFGEHLTRRRIYRTTANELGALSDHELADLGLHRDSIHAVARLAAFGE